MASDLLPPPDGSISQEDFDAYLEVVNAALAVHYDREKVRQGLWKDYIVDDQVNSIKVKIDRVSRSLEVLARTEDKQLLKEITNNIREELLDIINYSIFGIRQLS